MPVNRRFCRALTSQRRSRDQNQALSALLFLYQRVLGQQLPWLKDLVRAQRPVRLPTVLTEAEVRRLLEQTTGSARLMTAPAVRRGLEADRMPVAADQGR